ncbi:S-adenosylmethionine decarboxylase [Nanoarchaeota archaeon]
MTWKNLAPDLVRQRVIIEGTTKKIVDPDKIKEYLLESAKVTGMELMSGPFAYSAHEMGFGGWIHWKSSGSHFYSYPTNPPLFTVDTYTCKPFDIQKLVDFTKKFFGAIDIVWKEIKV